MIARGTEANAKAYVLVHPCVSAPHVYCNMMNSYQIERERDGLKAKGRRTERQARESQMNII